MVSEQPQPRILDPSPAPRFLPGQLVLVSIPGLGYQNVLARVVVTDKPDRDTCELYVLADARHPDEFSGNHTRFFPNRSLRLATREEVKAGLVELRKRFFPKMRWRVRRWTLARLVAIGDGWGWTTP